MVRRASCSPQRTHFLNQEVFQFAGSQQCFRFLIQIGFVGRTAAFCHAQEFIFVAVHAVQVDLRRQVSAGIHFFVHIQRRVLRVAQVIFNIGIKYASGERRFVTAAGPDTLTFFTHDNGRAGILTGWQYAFGGNLGVSQELQRNILIVFAGFRIMEYGGDLLLVFRAKHEGGIVEGLLGQ